MRLMGDIEKLTKQKINLLPIEFASEQPDIRKQGHFNSGHRVWDDEEKRGHRAVRDERAHASPRYAARPTPKAPVDPFFSTPYQEPTTSQAMLDVTPAKVGLSPNIKSKKKVAALFS
jgi:hypothetical protein